MKLNLQELFEKYNEKEYLKFDRIKNKLSDRMDVHAFILLDRLVPGKFDIISAAEHDEIFLQVDIEKLSEVITEEQYIDLIRCGVMYSSEYDCLMMFC